MPSERRSSAGSGRAAGLELEFLGTDRFEIRRRLGAGSMGVVYRAFDRERQTEVALKTLTRVDATSIYRFKREFRSLADVVHPNLVALYDLFAEGDLWFFTMEFVEGEDLLSHVHGSPYRTFAPTPRPTPRLTPEPGSDPRGSAGDRASQPQAYGLEMLFPTPVADEDRLRQVLLQVANGLKAVHAAGKLHRDLKPDNVLVTREGRAVVLDFGIMTERVASGHSTLEPDVMGTPAYMAPEQAAGKIVDEASDWYAFGALLYEALTGTLPFDGTYLQIMQQKQVEDPVPPLQVVYGVPEDLDALCMQLLQRDPRMRPTGAAVERALREHRAASVRPGSPPTHPPEAPAPFVGRAGELVALQHALEATDRGQPVAAFVRGPSGIGKTTLVQEFVRQLHATRETVVLRGRCYERERVPFKAFDNLVDSLSRYLKRLPAVEAGETLPRDIFALSQLFPVLARVDAVAQARRREPPPLEPHELRRRAFAALKEMFRRIADRSRLVVFIDDLQWGDVDSAELIAELLTGQDAPALLCILTYRVGEADRGQCLDVIFSRVRGQACEVAEITLDPLSHAETLELATLLLGPDYVAAVRSIGLEAGGSPHLVAELASHVRQRHETGTASADTQQGLVSFERALMRRVEQLSRGARTLLDLLSVAGKPVPEEVLALVSAFDIDLQSALVELRGAKLIRGVGTHDRRSVETYHDRIREVVIGAMPAQQLRAWHRRLAATFEAAGTVDLGAVTEHLLGARDFRRAHVYAVRAASQAAQALAFDKAARMFAIAVEHGPSTGVGAELLEDWADALANAGHGRQAAQVYFDAAGQAAPEAAAALRCRAGIQLLATGHRDEAVDMLRGSLGDLVWTLRPGDDDVRAAHAGLAERLARSTPFQDTGEVSPQTLVRLDAAWTLAFALTADGLGRPSAVVAQFACDAIDAGARAQAVWGLCALHCLGTETPESSPSFRERAEGWARPLDDARASAWLCLARARDAWRTGAVRTTVVEATRAEELFRTRCAGGVTEMRACRALLGYLAVTCGPPERIGASGEWGHEAEQHEDLLAGTWLRLLDAVHALVADERDRACDEIARAIARWSREDDDLVAMLEVVVRGYVDLYASDGEKCYGAVYRCDALLDTPFARFPPIRAHMLLLRARLALGAALGMREPDALLARAEEDVREVAALGLGCFAHHARLVRAAIAARRNDADTAMALLQAIVSDPSEAPDAGLTTACAQLYRGVLVPGDAGKLQRFEAEEALRAAGVANPRRFCRLYAPGFVG